jgi:hypothetical protein
MRTFGMTACHFKVICELKLVDVTILDSPEFPQK